MRVPQFLSMNAYAKINWCLAVTGRTEQGYHQLDMLMQRISLHDTVFAQPSDQLTLRVIGPEIAGDARDNLVLKAARALQRYAPQAGARITLVKRVPQGAGLGGGSSDAAAALRLLSRLWGLALSGVTLSALALELGADVPFFLDGRPARVRGIGERLSPAALPADVPLVLLQAAGGLNTGAVYARSDLLPPVSVDVPALTDLLARGDLRAANGVTGNALYPAAVSMQPLLETAKRAVETSGALYTLMTGSGSVIYGAYASDGDALRAAEALRTRFPGAYVSVTRTLS